MKTFFYLTKRNIKVFFTDKGMLFTSMITPIILLVLYSTFLADLYKSSFINSTKAFAIGEELVNSIVSGQIVSSLLAVCCITVSFCSNALMAEDKVKKVVDDFLVSPIRRSTLQLSYFFATWVSTLIVNFLALIACFIYVAITGWSFSVSDVFLLISDVIILSAFGSALSSAINFFLKTQGQISCVGTIVSAGYGFICGAYMPLSQLNEGVRNCFMFLPGTYGTALIRRHALKGAMAKLSEVEGMRPEILDKIKESVDYNIKFFSSEVPLWVMYLVLVAGIAVCILLYIGFSILKKRKAN